MRWWLVAALSLLGASCSRRDTAALSASSTPSRATSVVARAPRAAPVPSGLMLTPRGPGFSTAKGRLGEHEWHLTRVDLRSARLRIRALESRNLSDSLADPRLSIAVNGGFFDRDFAASGLLLSGGTKLAETRRGGGSGILTVHGSRAELFARDDVLPPNLDFAVQCGPRLIERDGSVGIHRNDEKRAARTVACIRDAGRTLELIVVFTPELPGDGPTLFELSRRLSEPLVAGDQSGCGSALNLDGGPSTGMMVPAAPELRHDPVGPVPFALVVETRNGN